MLPLYIPFPALNNPLPVNKDTPKVPSNIGIKDKAPPFLSFLSVSVIPFINTSESYKVLTILVMSYKSLLENLTAFVPEFFEFPKP